MSAGRVIEYGVIHGKSYRVWQCWKSGKKIVYVGVTQSKWGQTGKRRTMKWLKKQKRLEHEAQQGEPDE